MPSERADAIAGFLDQAGWGGAARAPLAGDASMRRYERLSRAGETAVLMDAPPPEDVRPFLSIARHLATLGLSAPRILAADGARGLLLLEDLGDDLFARIVAREPDREGALYTEAAALLAALHRHAPPEGLPQLDATTMPALTAPAFEWYLAHAAGPAAPVERAALEEALGEALVRLSPAPSPVLALRDFHAENLLWLPGRTGIARVGLLDFQDACAAHPAYDLVSLLEDARRDVAEPVRTATIRRYAAATGTDETALVAAMAVQGAQRNLRIMGVFARLSLHAGKPHYVDLMPRVWAHLRRDLSHPALAGLARAARLLPEPTPAIRQRLKDLCGTFPPPCPTR